MIKDKRIKELEREIDELESKISQKNTLQMALKILMNSSL